jgi:hypothetical protein
MIGVRRFGAIGLGRLGRRVRMRMIEANDLEPASPCVASAVDMILRIDQKPRGLGGDVPRTHGLHNLVTTSDQQPAALRRRRLPRVLDDRSQSAV